MYSQEQNKWGESTVRESMGNSLNKGRGVGRRGSVGREGHAAMAKSQALGPDARVQVPSAPLKHQLTSGNSCDPVLPYFPQQ